VCDALREVVEAVQLAGQEKSLHLECAVIPVPVSVSGNAATFKEAITNLLLNAIKYTPPQGTVSIRTELQDKAVVIEISDTGIGVPQEEQVRIFEEFYRASNARQMEPDGDGLGLSLVTVPSPRQRGSSPGHSFGASLTAGYSPGIIRPSRRSGPTAGPPRHGESQRS
jgi:signal transduction histidine kinase